MASGTSSDAALGDVPMVSLSGIAALWPFTVRNIAFNDNGCYHPASCQFANYLFGQLQSSLHAITKAQTRLGCMWCAQSALPSHMYSLLLTEECVKLREDMDRMVTC